MKRFPKETSDWRQQEHREQASRCVNKETENVTSESAPRGHFAPVTSTFQLRGIFLEVDKSRHLLVLLAACKDGFFFKWCLATQGRRDSRIQPKPIAAINTRTSEHAQLILF